MTDFQQKKKIRSFLYSKISLLILVVLVFFLAKATYNLYYKYSMSADDYSIVKNEYDNLKTRKDMLDSEIARLKTESGIEEEIRSKFNVAKPGEQVVVVINNNASSTEKNGQNEGFWAKVWSIFK